jgi:hypothetical protein
MTEEEDRRDFTLLVAHVLGGLVANPENYGEDKDVLVQEAIELVNEALVQIDNHYDDRAV